MLLLQAPSPNVKTAVERIIAAHAKMTVFEAKIERPGAPAATIARRDGTVWLRLSDSTGLFPTTRTICATTSRGWIYDAFFAEIVGAPVKGGTPFERLVSLTGAADDAYRLLLEPKTLAIYLRAFSALPNATLSGSTLTFPGKGGAVRVTFDPTTRRVTRISSSIGETRTVSGAVTRGSDVRYHYGAFGLGGFAPTSARATSRLTVMTGAATFASSGARSAIGRMLRANSRLVRARIGVETDGGTYTVAFSGANIRQIGPRLDLGYDGRTLVVVDRRERRTYRGPAKRGDVRRVAAKLGEPLLALSNSFLNRTLPFQGFFFPPRRATLGATLSGPGGTTDAVKLSAGETYATLFIRPDGLIASLQSEEQYNGRVVAFERQRFTYESAVGNPGFPTAIGQVRPLP